MNDPVPLTVGGLFSGIGGIELGLERAGMRVLWHCEADPFCQHILGERWPGVPCFPDVRDLVADTTHESADVHAGHAAAPQREGGHEPRDRDPGVRVPVPYVDVLCGGFPCQDISLAGAGAGITGSRSGLWVEFARLIGELRPRYVLIENVAALLARGLNVVLSDLAALGFDAEWDCVPASAVGAPHRRDRVWIVAYPNSEGPQGHGGLVEGPGERLVAQGGAAHRSGVAYANGSVGDAEGSAGEALPRPAPVERPGRRGSSIGNPWAVEPDVGRVAHGIPARVDRLKSLGNAVVPQIPEWIGRRIIAWEQQEQEQRMTSTTGKEAA